MKHFGLLIQLSSLKRKDLNVFSGKEIHGLGTN